MIEQPSEWTGLEITKLVVSTLTPLILLFLGLWVNRIAKRIESAEWANQKLIEKRIVIYDELASLINDLYCYYMCVGNWKDLTPPQIVAIKRKLDKKIYIYASLFSHEFIGRYNIFIARCFRPYVAGEGHDARLRTLKNHPMGGDRSKSSTETWKPEWDALFSTEEECSSSAEIRSRYESLMAQFAEELGVGLKPRKRGQTKDDEENQTMAPE